MKRSHLRMEGEPPYSPAVPDDLPDAPPRPDIIPSSGSSQDEPGVARSLPAAEEVDIPAQIDERDRILAAAPQPWNGFLAGAAAAVVGTALFGGLAGAGGCSYKTLVVGAGFLAIAAVRRFGRGHSTLFSLMGAGWGLVACSAACLIATCCELARRAGVPALKYADVTPNWVTILHQSFGPSEFLWCGAVVVAGWMLSRNAAPPDPFAHNPPPPWGSQ